MLRLAAVAATLAAAAAAVLVPGPVGPFGVAMRVRELTDQSRWDPYAPASRPHKRRILVSVFMPLEPGRDDTPVCAVPYMPHATAAGFGQLGGPLGALATALLSNFSIEYHQLPPPRHGPVDRHRPRYPVVLFSPGLGASRLGYAAGARALAGQGYVVITVDHPYDASVVEFPDASVVRAANISSIPDVLRSVEVRAADMSFLFDSLHDPSTRRQLTAGFPGELDLARVAMHGHSLGGATAAAAMLKDKRIRGGLDWDGHVFGPVVREGLDGPFTLVGVPGREAVPNSSWPELYAHLRGPKAELAVAKTQHGSFTDFPLLVTAVRIPDADRAALELLIGGLDGRQLQRIVVGILTAFLDLVFRGKGEGMRSLGSEFCHVSVVKSRLPDGR